MTLSRRGFLKLSGFMAAGALVPFGVAEKAFNNEGSLRLHKPVGETNTICPYCAVGCGAIVATQDNRVLNVEGDPDHPISEGSLCSKAMALSQVNTVNGEVNPRRLQKVLYRAPGGTEWEEKPWSWAMDQIARRVKNTRDQYFIQQDEQGRTVNRLEAIASLGGAALDNEECSLIVKAMRSLGLVFIEHQARI